MTGARVGGCAQARTDTREALGSQLRTCERTGQRGSGGVSGTERPQPARAVLQGLRRRLLL